MSVIDKSRLISWLDAQERCYAAELDKCRPTSNHYKSCQAKNEAFQAVILRINMGDFDDSQLAALKEENERLKDEYLQLFNKRSGRVENLQKAVWSALDRASCPGVFLQIASHAIHKHGCAEIADLKKALECAQARVAELEAREVDAIANKICGHLPKGYYIKLCLEKEAGWVELDSPDVATDRDDFEGGIYSQLLCALEVAEELSKEPANER